MLHISANKSVMGLQSIQIPLI